MQPRHKKYEYNRIVKYIRGQRHGCPGRRVILRMIMVRISAFIYTAPFFSIGSVPQRVKIGLSAVLSYLAFTLLLSIFEVSDTVVRVAGSYSVAMEKPICMSTI